MAAIPTVWHKWLHLDEGDLHHHHHYRDSDALLVHRHDGGEDVHQHDLEILFDDEPAWSYGLADHEHLEA